MAGTLTHNKFGYELYSRLNIKNLDLNFFVIGNQGHDLLYFIKLWEYPKRKKYNNYIKKLQKVNIKEFPKYWHTDDIKLRSFLYGYVAHEILDNCVHPYINEKSNNHDYEHALLESKIDYLLTDLKNLKIPYKIVFTKEMKNTLNTIFTNYFHSSKYSERMLKTVNYVWPFVKRYRLDKYGLKKMVYKIINYKKFRFLAYNYKKEELQIDIQPFLTLYNKALDEAEKLINFLENKH